MVDLAGHSRSYCVRVCSVLLVMRCLRYMCYLLKIRRLFMYTNTDKAIDCLCATMWIAMFILLMGI